MMEDAFQLGETSSSSHSDLVEVLSEAAEREANRPVAQDSMPPDGPPLYSASELVEEVEKAMESEAVRLLAARVPPELFDDILFYVNVARVSRRGQLIGGDLIRRREPSPIDLLTDLKQCSLVCLFWANRCREHMFSEQTLVITSYEDAEIFRRYVVGGCLRLTPVNQLIGKIEVYQDYKSRRSFIHLLYLPVIRDKLRRLNIYGSVPDSFNPAKLDTPHWGIPPCTVVPSSFLLDTIFLEDVHLPSFYHVTKYIRHFACAAVINFGDITWDGQTPTYSLPQASNRIICQHRPHSLTIWACGGCTDAVHLALTALMMNPNCPLHRLSDEERAWVIKFMTLLWGDKPDPDVRIGFNISEQTTTMELDPFYLVFEEASASTDRSVSALSVVGIIWSNRSIHGKLPANFDALVNSLRTHPTIRALVLLFDSFDRLQKSMKPFVHLLGPATEALDPVLAYLEEEEPRWWRKETSRALGVDPVTLEPTGRIWADLPTTGLSGPGAASLEILRPELKKRR